MKKYHFLFFSALIYIFFSFFLLFFFVRCAFFLSCCQLYPGSNVGARVYVWLSVGYLPRTEHMPRYQWMKESEYEWLINRRKKKALWSVSKALLKSQFLDWDPNYLPSKIYKYRLHVFIDMKHLCLNRFLFFFLFPFHIISLGDFCSLSSFLFFSLLFG
jgi:hypothetical protein